MKKNHWGKWIDSEIPITGVISSNNVEWSNIEDEICPVCEEIQKSHDEQREIDEEYEEDEDWECFDHEKLIGDWVLDTKTRKWDISKAAEFAAIVTDSTFNCVQVVFSKYTKKCGLCSPCFPGQGDLDSDGEFLAYDLPEYLKYVEEN